MMMHTVAKQAVPTCFQDETVALDPETSRCTSLTGDFGKDWTMQYALRLGVLDLSDSYANNSAFVGSWRQHTLQPSCEQDGNVDNNHKVKAALCARRAPNSGFDLILILL